MANRKSNRSLMLFLGSGVSYDSGLPNVSILTAEVLTGKWHAHTDSNFYPGHELDRPDAWTTRVQSFLKILKGHADAYFSKRRQTEPTYEDLFFMARQIEDELMGNVQNPAIAQFLSKLQKQTRGLCRPILPIEQEFSLRELASITCDYIECVVWHSLRANKPPRGFDLLVGLGRSKRFNRLDICTLNHDLLVETTLNAGGIDYVDGFGPLDGDVRWFSPEVYDKRGVRIRLFKLHGSVNWWRMERERSGQSLFLYASIRTAVSPFHCKNARGERISDAAARPRFLTGSHNKISDYRYGIFAEIHLRFFQLLRMSNMILMSGYGWNDRGINGWLSEWLSSSRQNRIVLLHRQPEEIRDHSHSNMWHRFNSLVENGQLILVRKWFSETPVAELQEFLDETPRTT